MAESEFTPNRGLELPAHGSYEGNWEVPVNANMESIDAAFAASAAENGHIHSGEAGQGPKVDHANLENKGTNTHAEIDAHIADTTIHLDGVKVGTVSGENSSGAPLSVDDVTEIQFVNATIADLGSGVVEVTSQAQSLVDPTFYAKPESASVGYTDNFNWSAGTLASSYSWTTSLSATNHKDWTISGASVGDGVVFRTENNAGDKNPSGHGLLHCVGHVPRGTAQRITVKVDSIRPVEDDNGSIPYSASLTYINDNCTDDLVLLSLDLMSSSDSLDIGRPCLYGLSMLIKKLEGGTTLRYELNVKSSSSSTDAGAGQGLVWSDFSGAATSSGDLQGQPYTYIEGWHELSLRRHPTIPSAFYVHYYHNEGLMWSKLFDPNSTVEQESAFAYQIYSLAETLLQSSAPKKNPSHGRIGVSFGYNLDITKSHKYELKLRHVSIGSQDDEIQPKEVDVPTVTVPWAGVQACSSGVFSTLQTGDEFPFSGPGTEAEYTVIEARSPNDVGYRSKTGIFVVRNDSDVTTYDPQNPAQSALIVYCSSPSPASPPCDSAFIYSGYSGIIDLFGGSIPRGDFFGGFDNLKVRVKAASAGIATDWNSDTTFSGTTYSVGDVLPSSAVDPLTSFITVTSIDGRTDRTLDTQLDKVSINYSAGKRLPIGQTVSIEVYPDYDPTFVAAWTPVKIFPLPPRVMSNSTLVWDEEGFVAAQNSWYDATPEQNEADVLEGSTVCFGVSARNLPLGDNWTNTDGFIDNNAITTTEELTGPYSVKLAGADNYAMCRNGSVPAAIRANHVSKYFDAVMSHGLEAGIGMITSASQTIAPPVSTNTSLVRGHLQVAFEKNTDTTQDSVVQVFKISDNIFAEYLKTNPITITNVVDFRFADTFNAGGCGPRFPPGLTNQSIPVVYGSQLFPRNPEIVARSITPQTLSSGASVTINLVVRYHHDAIITDDLDVTAMSGFSGGLTVTKYFGDISSTASTPTSVGGNNATRRLVIQGTLASSGEVKLLVEKQATVAWLAANASDTRVIAHPEITGDVVVSFGDISVPAQPTVGAVTGGVTEGEWKVVNITLLGATVLDNGTYSIGELIQSGIDLYNVPGFVNLAAYPYKIYRGANSGGYKSIDVHFYCGDAGGASTFSFQVRNSGNTATGATATVSVTAMVAPSITDGGLDPAFTSHDWDLSANQPTTRPVFIQTANLKSTSIIEAQLQTATTASISVVGGNWVSLGAGVYSARIALVGTEVPDEDDYITVTVRTPFPGGTDKTDTFGNTTPSEFVRFVQPVVVNNNVVVQGVDIVGQNIYGGQYFEFKLNGFFRMTGITYSAVTGYDASQIDSRFTVDFLDKTDGSTSLLVPGTVTITSGNEGQLVGYAQAAAYSNEVAQISVTDTGNSSAATFTVDQQIEGIVTFKFPPIAQISQTATIEEGSTQTITVFGSALVPPSGPASAPLVFYGYALDAAPGVITSVGAINATFNTAQIQNLVVAAATAGEKISLVVTDPIVGPKTSKEIITILPAPVGTPQVDAFFLLNRRGLGSYIANSYNYNAIPAAQLEIRTGAGSGAAYIVVEGSNLGTQNVDWVNSYITICGDDTANSKMPPAFGWHPAYVDNRQIPILSLYYSNGSILILNIGEPLARLANARVKLFLANPAGGFYSAAAIDNTGVTGTGTVTNYGLTAAFGRPVIPANIDYFLNYDPTAGITHYDVNKNALDDIAALGGSYGPGTPITVAFRLKTARSFISLQELEVIPDAINPNAKFLTDTPPTSTDGGVGLEWEIGLAFTSDCADGDVLGLRFVHGPPILCVRLGETDWGASAGDVTFA